MQKQIPDGFKEYALGLLGEERYARFAQSLEEAPSVSIRLNKSKAAGVIETPMDCNMSDEPVRWAEDAFYLSERPAFTADPLFHAGAYYVQEASSMFLECALRQYVEDPVVALDLCAAPGGKSTHTRSLLPKGSFLVSNEPIKARAQVLAENMTKWGYADVAVTNSYPSDFKGLNHFFDLIITDVPCSGEGMFRKEEDAVTGWSMENVEMCSARQRDILQDVWSSLKPGGILIYSTCTFNQYEDEENVKWIAEELGAEVLPVHINEEWNIIGNLLPDNSFPVYHFLQGFIRGEGFFLAVLRKNGDSNDVLCEEKVAKRKEKNKKSKEQNRPNKLPQNYKQWLKGADKFDYQVIGEQLVAVPIALKRSMDALDEHVNVMQKAITLATRKGDDWIPSHPLAMSNELNTDAFPCVELDYKAAVSYLRKEVLTLSPEVPKGFVLVTFCGLPLGFVKNIGSRANNLYPQEWKIRSSHLTDFCIKKDLG